MKYLTYEEFKTNADRNMQFAADGTPVGHWLTKGLEHRWNYHARAIEVIRNSSTDIPERVLEMGTMGAQIVHDSHTIDYDEDWHFQGFNPTYLHDARKIPWPIESKRYDWFIALRVFHHLWPLQRQCFEEARRIAKNVLIVVPSVVPKAAVDKIPRTDAGITPMQFLEWANGTPPQGWQPLQKFGNLYWWSDVALGSRNSLSRGFYITQVNAVQCLRWVKKSLKFV